MKKINLPQRTCAICAKSFPDRNVVSGEMVCKEIADEIIKIEESNFINNLPFINIIREKSLKNI